MRGSKRSNFRKNTFKLKIQFLVFMKNLVKQFVLIAQSILKLDDSLRKNRGGWIITYIRVRVRDVSRRLAHEAKVGEVTWLAFELLIVLWARGVIAGEVEVTEGSTHSGHHLLELLLLLVPEAVLLLVVALAVVISLGVVILVGGGVKLLPLGAVDDKVGGVATLEVAPRWSPPLLAVLVQGVKLSCQQGDLIIEDSLILFIRSCSQRGQGKLQSRWYSGVGGVCIMATNMSTSNQSLTRERSMMIQMTFSR
jgi:hypothetical protein